MQVLAGAPCLVCGHEEQIRRSGSTWDSELKPGMWVHLQKVGQDTPTEEEEIVRNWFTALGISKPDLSVKEKVDGVMWKPKASDNAGRTIQVLNQWAKQKRFDVVTDWMMSWSTVLPRRRARLSQSVLDGARNPFREGDPEHPQLQCLAMCQSFQARRALQSATTIVRAESAQLLQSGLLHGLWILCSLWGDIQIRFRRGENADMATAYELQGVEDYKPDVLSVPLCEAGVQIDDVLQKVNECREALNEFFCKMTLESQAQTLKTFVGLRDYSVTFEAAANTSPGPTSFIMPMTPEIQSSVIMPDAGAAAWGLSSLRSYSQEELDEIGKASVKQVLEMLKRGEPMGIEKKMSREKAADVANAKYKVDWTPERVLQTSIAHDLLDQRGRMAASNRLLRIPVKKHYLDQDKCQDNATREPTDCAGLKCKVFYHGTPLYSVPSILTHGLRASRRSHGYVGLWCRDKLEQALTWCTCPAVQYFPCVALELAAWNGPQEGYEDQEHGKILQNRHTSHIAFCILVQCAKTAESTDRLPPVALRALWVAMPRSHMHFRQISELQRAYEQTVKWVAEFHHIDLSRKGRRYGTRAGTLTGHLSQLTERRLVYWGLGGEHLNLKGVQWPRKRISHGILALSLDCARCIRVAEGNGNTNSGDFPWDRVPVPFREWLQMRGKNCSHFLHTATAEDEVSKDALSQWKDLLMPTDEAPGTFERHLVLPAPVLQQLDETDNSPDTAECIHSESNVEDERAMRGPLAVAFEHHGSVASSSGVGNSSRAQHGLESSCQVHHADLSPVPIAQRGRNTKFTAEAFWPQIANETEARHIAHEGHMLHDRRGSGGSSDGPAVLPSEDMQETPVQGSHSAGSCQSMDKKLDDLLQYLKDIEKYVEKLEVQMLRIVSIRQHSAD